MTPKLPSGTTETFAAHTAQRSARWCRWVTIEGIGSSSGLYRFCDSVPPWATGDAVWKPYLRNASAPLPQSTDRGGVTRFGEFLFELLDKSDEVTALLKIDTRPRAYIVSSPSPSGALARGDADFVISSATGISVGQILWLGREAVLVLDVAGTSIRVERGILDTDEENHPNGELIYTSIPFLEGRKVRLWFASGDGKTGLPWPALNATETLDDALNDAISLRMDETSGNPQDSSRNARHATTVDALSYSVGGALGPNWRSIGFNGSSSRVELPKFQPSQSFVVVLPILWTSFTSPSKQAPVAFTRNGGEHNLLTIWTPYNGSTDVLCNFIEGAGTTTSFNLASNPTAGEWYQLELQVADVVGGSGAILRFFWEGVLVHTATSTRKTNFYDWTDGTAYNPHLGCDVDPGLARNDFFNGRIAFRLINGQSGPYHAAERYRNFRYMTQASAEWGVYRLEPPALSPDLNVWRFRGQSENCGSRVLIVPRAADRFTISEYQGGPGLILGRHSTDLSPSVLWPSGKHCLHVDGAVLECSLVSSRAYHIERRGVGGTPVDPKIERGARGSLVYAVDGDHYRYSPGPSLGGGTPSTSRSSGTWTIAKHWIPITLTIMTSSSDSGDGLELTNYDPAHGNFASLPPGVGIGYPFHRINWSAFLDVWKRTPDWVFEGFFLGHEQITFGELLDREFLRPLGASLDEYRGKATIVLPRLPLAGETLLELGPSTLLAKKIDPHRALPDIEFRKTNAKTRSSIIFRVRAPNGQTVQVAVNDVALRRLYGNKRVPLPFKPETIDVPSALIQEDGNLPWLERLGARWLFYTRRSSWDIDAGALWDLESVKRGEFLGITHRQFPDLSTGARGITGEPARVEERRPVLAVGEQPHLRLKLSMFGQDLRVARIAPSARIVSVSGAGPYVVTCEANVYTDADGPSDLPARDVLAFSSGHVLRLSNRNGSSAAAGTSTIQVAPETDGTNKIRVNSNFGGALAAGLVLDTAAYADQAADQKARYVTAADRATRTIGATSDAAWQFAQE